jgi:hypothetical protein
MATGRCSALLLFAFVSTAGAQPAAEPQPWPFLRKVIGLTDAQLGAVQRGEVVTKQLPSPEKPEIAAFGVVKVQGTTATLRAKLRDFQSFRKVPQIPEIGRFSDPPRIEDLNDLHWPQADLDALKRCKAGECDVKLGTASLERLRKEIDWNAPDVSARLTALIKDQMVDYVTAYRAGGTDSLAVSVDKSQPKAFAAEFRTLLRNSPYLPQYVPAFHQYLESYPKGTLPNTTDTLYWTKDEFGLKPVVSMYHATIYEPQGPSQPGLLVAIKTLYASHFFNAGLEIMAAVPTQEGVGFYLLDLYRTRIDPPTGMLSGVLMGKVKSGVEKGISLNLTTAKARVEGR